MKTIHIFTILCLFSTLTMSTTCEDNTDIEVSFVTIENRADETIYICSDFCEYGEILTPYGVFELFPSSLHKVEKGGNIQEATFPEFLDSLHTFQLIIFKQSTMDKYSKEELVEKNIFDKRYVLSLNHLTSMGFRIIYNGESDIEQTDLQQ